jgi:hypothetical protein
VFSVQDPGRHGRNLAATDGIYIYIYSGPAETSDRRGPWQMRSRLGRHGKREMTTVWVTDSHGLSVSVCGLWLCGPVAGGWHPVALAQTMAVSEQQGDRGCQKMASEPFFLASGPFLMASEPFLMASEPFLMASAPAVAAHGLCASDHGPWTSPPQHPPISFMPTSWRPCHGDLVTATLSRRPCHDLVTATLSRPCHGDLVATLSRRPCHDLVTATLSRPCHGDLVATLSRRPCHDLVTVNFMATLSRSL